jgi:hypothetical protein
LHFHPVRFLFDRELLKETKMALDRIGQKIEVGDTITYPGRSGSSQWLNFSLVTGIKDVKNRYTGWTDSILKVQTVRTGKNTTVYCLERVIKLSHEQVAALVHTLPDPC